MGSRRHGGGRVRRKQISRKTVARRLRGGGLYARRPVVCVPLTRQHRTARLQWCRDITIGLNRTRQAYYSQMRDCLDREGIQRLVWPARSPDLNPIENVWDGLGRQVAGRNYPPTNKNTLIRALTEEWDKLPQQLLDNVVESMVMKRMITSRLDWYLETNNLLTSSQTGFRKCQSTNQQVVFLGQSIKDALDQR
ncbi:hypothetical protein TNCV_2668371 [Trichonephila clavipes]|nr:hypothetical protein TNCV_2668371 [Trichonephila clavipes]